MLKKRIIPCLDIKEGRTVKGVNFIGLQDAGDPVQLAQMYTGQGADELIFLDITATVEARKTLLKLVHRISEEINIPFTVGGGINTVEDAARVIESGADKVSLNSAAINSPTLIADIADRFGSQCVVVAIDTKEENGSWEVYKNGGRIHTGLKTLDWALDAERLGAGEILLTSMNNDGTKTGFAENITRALTDELGIPVIASGGAGNQSHFRDIFSNTAASAALAASVFHFGEIKIPDLKNYLKNENINVRCI